MHGFGKRGPIALIVSSVASTTPRLPDRVVALANWFLRSSYAALRAARCALLLLARGGMSLFALSASVSSCPLFRWSSLATISDFTVVDDAPGFCGPKTRVGKRNSASNAASCRTFPCISTALFMRPVTTGRSCDRLGLGRFTADWHPDVLMCSGVKSGCAQQNSTCDV